MKPDDTTLRHLYCDEKVSYAEIARRHGVTANTVMRWLRAAGVPARSMSEANKLAKRNWKPTEQHRERLRENLAKARAARTAESNAKWRAKLDVWYQNNPHPRQGHKWTPEERAKHMEYRKTREYREKLSAAHRGDKSYNWRGGQTTAEQRRMQGYEWREQRKRCYERDNWTCRDCGVKCNNGVRINAHHIIPRRHGGGDELENLLTLCASCHQKRERRYRGAFIA